MDSRDIIIMLKQRQGPRTQAQLSQEIGCTPEHLCQVLAGRRLPRGRILEFLGMRWNDDVYEKRSSDYPFKGGLR